MSTSQEDLAGAILVPGERGALAREPNRLRTLKHRMNDFVSDVCVTLSHQSPVNRQRIPDDMRVVESKIQGVEGPLVSIFWLLTELNRPVLVELFDRDPLPTWVFESLLDRWKENKQTISAVYVEVPARRSPFPMVVHPRLKPRLEQPVRHNPPKVKQFLRQVQAQKIQPSQ